MSRFDQEVVRKVKGLAKFIAYPFTLRVTTTGISASTSIHVKCKSLRRVLPM